MDKTEERFIFYTLIRCIQIVQQYRERRFEIMGQNGIWVPCDNCGTLIYRTQYRLKKNEHHFCNNKCQKEFIHKSVSEIRWCEICGKPFEVLKTQTKRFCSSDCQAKWQRTQIGDLNARFTGQKIKCDYCGALFYVCLSKIKSSTHHFCSKSCRQKWFAEVYSQQQEVKEASRKRALDMLDSGRFKSESTPQAITNFILDEMKVPYQNERVIGYWSFDNWLVGTNLLIEVMGDFWHGSPIRYGTYDSLSAQQKNRIMKDRQKNSYAKAKGLQVLYLWEKDVLTNPDLCRALIERFIENKGLMENYHSFNYKLAKNSALCLQEQQISHWFE